MAKAKVWLTSLYYFVTSRIFLKNFVVFVGIFLFFSFSMFQCLGWYTRHGQKVTVPSLVGMTVEEAEKVLGKNHLEVFVSDTRYVSGKKPNEIISQEPIAGYKVKQNRKIYVIVADSRPPVHPISMHDIGRDIAEIRQIYKRNMFDVTEIPIPGDLKGVVQEIKVDGKSLFKHGDPKDKPSQNFPEGTKVTVYYIQGLGDEPESVHDLVGMTFAEARGWISLNGFNLGAVIADESDMTEADSAAAFVTQQSPAAEDFNTIRKGEAYNLWISKNPK